MAYSFDRHLEAILLRQRGNNHQLIMELKEKLSIEGKERLYRVMEDMEGRVNMLMSRVRRYGV